MRQVRQLGVIVGILGVLLGTLPPSTASETLSVITIPSPPKIGQPMVVLVQNLPPILSAQATLLNTPYRTHVLSNGRAAFLVASTPSPAGKKGLTGLLAYRLASGDRKEGPLLLGMPTLATAPSPANNDPQTQLINRMGTLEQKRTQLMAQRTRPASTPSQLDTQLAETNQSILETLDTLFNTLTNVPPLAEPPHNQSGTITRAAFEAREKAYLERLDRLDEWVALRGKEDPDVIAETKALEKEDAALTQMEALLTQASPTRTGASAVPTAPPPPTTTDRQKDPITSTPPLSWEGLQQERDATLASLVRLTDQIKASFKERMALPEEEDSKTPPYQVLQQQRQKEYDAVVADVLQTQQEIKVKQIERQQLQAQLDTQTTQLSQSTQTTGPDYQRRQSAQQSLQNSIQNKTALMVALGNILTMKERRLIEAKNKLDQANEAVASHNKGVGFDRRALWQFDTALSKKISGLSWYQEWGKSYEGKLKRLNQLTPNPSSLNEGRAAVSSGNRLIKAILEMASKTPLSVPPPAVSKPRAAPKHWLLQSYWAMGTRCGYQWFSDASYSSGPGCGGHLWGDWGNGWAMRAGAAWVSSMKQYRTKSVWQAQFHLMPRLLTALDGAVYGIVGGEVNEASPGLSPTLGVGAQWVFSPNVMGSLDLVGGKDWSLSLSVNRRFGDFEYQEEAMPRLESALSPHLSLGVEGVKRVFRFNDVSLDGLNGHWAKTDIERMVKLGLLEETPQYPLVPNRLLTFLEAARMIAFAKNAPSLLESEPIQIWFTISNTEGEPVTVRLQAFGPDEQPVATLIDHQTYPEGQHMLSWDAPVLLPSTSGPLSLLLSLSLLDKNGQSLAQEQLEVPTRRYDSLGKIDASLGLQSDTRKTQARLLAEWQAMGNASTSLTSIQTLKNRPKAIKMNPNGELSRLSFVMAISNVIKSIRGSKTVVTSDLTPYKDVASFPKNAIASLYIYTTELDYGGDTNGNLRPFSNITLAEASRMISRLLDWQEKRTGIVVPR